MPKAGDITRKWYVIDAAGKPLGKVAVQASFFAASISPHSLLTPTAAIM